MRKDDISSDQTSKRLCLLSVSFMITLYEICINAPCLQDWMTDHTTAVTLRTATQRCFQDDVAAVRTVHDIQQARRSYCELLAALTAT